jgi:hypothetical protein
VLDFTELPVDGNDLELLARELFFAKGNDTRWSGRGPDGGADLLVVESGLELFGEKERTWLVSCKHNAHGGAAVGVGALAGLLEDCRAHEASGFLLVCTTYLSAAAVSRLDELERAGRDGVVTHYIDATRLERLLETPQLWAVAQRFMPVSAGRWRVWATESPNRYIVAARGHWFYMTNRHSSDPELMLGTVDAQLDILEAVELPAGCKLRLRAIWYDDAHANCVWYIDLLHPRRGGLDLDEDDEGRIANALWNEQVLDDGQYHSIDLMSVEADFGGDRHDDDHYSYYSHWAGDFVGGGRRERGPFRRRRS